MKKYSLYAIVLGVFIASILIISFLINLLVVSHKQDLIQSAINEKIKMAETIRETIASPSWLYRMSVLGDLDKGLIIGLSRFEDINFIRIVKASREIYQSTFEEEIGTIIDDPDIARAIESGMPVIKDQVFNNENIKVLIYPGYEDQTVWIGFSLKGVQILMKEVLLRYLFIACSIFILLGFAMIIILRNIVDPIKKITRSCEDVRNGNLDIKLGTGWKTEIGELAETFNEMIKDIKESRSKLEEAKDILEIRVGARTQELQDLANSLEGQVKERTNDLQEKIKQLEVFNHLAVDRELKMAKLKEEIKELKKELEKKS
jgi:HAMP domain-containing protein